VSPVFTAVDDCIAVVTFLHCVDLCLVFVVHNSYPFLHTEFAQRQLTGLEFVITW